MDRDPVTDQQGRERIVALCQQIISIAKEERLSRFQLASAILRFVQEEILYEYDDESTRGFIGGPFSEYGRFPVETGYDGVGDCECTSILCTSILAYLGFDSALLHVKLIMPVTGEVSHHAAVGLDVSGLFLSGDEISEEIYSLDYIADPATQGTRYLYGETACEKNGPGFGVIPPEWRDGMEVVRVAIIPAVVAV